MFTFLSSLLASLLEKVGWQWWTGHEQKEKAQEDANAPITDKEESDYWRKP